MVKDEIGILNCPFCGSNELEFCNYSGSRSSLAFIHCKGCKARGPNIGNENESLKDIFFEDLAIKKWEKRWKKIK